MIVDQCKHDYYTLLCQIAIWYCKDRSTERMSIIVQATELLKEFVHVSIVTDEMSGNVC